MGFHSLAQNQDLCSCMLIIKEQPSLLPSKHQKPIAYKVRLDHYKPFVDRLHFLHKYKIYTFAGLPLKNKHHLYPYASDRNNGR